MKILVTGSNGLLGGALAQRLARDGHDVFGIDAVARSDATCPVHVATLGDPYTMHRAFDRFGVPDAVAHLANHTNAQHAPAELVLRENLSMNASVFMAALEAGTRRLVFASSVQTMLGGIERWGEPGQGAISPPAFPISERLPARPTNTYALSKLMTEQALDHASGDAMGFGATCVSVRLPFILREAAFERNLTSQGLPDYRWGGCEAYCYLHVNDAADAMARALTRELPSGEHHVVWCAAPDPRGGATVSELVDAYYTDVPGAQEAAGRGTFHDCSRAHDLLGWSPERVLERARAERVG